MKTISIISILYGTLGLIWGTLIMVIVRIQKAIFENFPFPDEINEYFDVQSMMEVLHDIWGWLLPFILVIAIVYIVSGILGLTDKPMSVTFTYLAAVFNIIWYVAYVIILQVELLPVMDFSQFFPQKLFTLLFFAGTLLNAVFYCGYPVFLIIFLSRQKQIKI